MPELVVSPSWTILSIVDTRTYEEGPDDKFHPIPNSGDARECDRCHKTHEIHAHVAEVFPNTRTYTVGVGCAKTGSIEFDSRIKSATSAAMTLARLRAQADRLQIQRDEWERVHAEVVALPLPGYTSIPSPWMSGAEEWRTVDGRSSGVQVMPYNRKDERLDCLYDSWRAAMMLDRGQTSSWNRYADALEDVRVRIYRTEQKMRDIATGAAK